jgi:hypothetical protein
MVHSSWKEAYRLESWLVIYSVNNLETKLLVHSNISFLLVMIAKNNYQLWIHELLTAATMNYDP